MSYIDNLKNNNTEFAIYQDIYDAYVSSLDKDEFPILFNSSCDSCIVPIESTKNIIS